MSKKKKILLAAAGLLLILITVLTLIFGFKTISFDTGSALITKKSFVGTSIDFPAAKAPEGYVFCGWEGKTGDILAESKITVRENIKYKAVFKLSLYNPVHEVLIFPDECGFYHLDEPMQRSELVQIISRFISAPVTGSENYYDVNKSASYAEAAAIFKELKLIDGERLKPKANVSSEELCSILEKFAVDDVLLSSLSLSGNDKELSRLQIIELILKAAGRKGPDNIPEDLAGAVPDTDPNSDAYRFALEAAVSHEYAIDKGNETWTSYKPVNKLEPGLILVSNRLYFVNDDGTLLRNSKKGNFSFGQNGVFTTGNSELDELIFSVLDKLSKNCISRQELLEACYDYTVSSLTYLKGNLYSPGETGWAEKEAFSMLNTGYGNCYGYAAAFYEFARALGYDARAYSGYMGANGDHHGWVEIEIDGENYYFDPELEMSTVSIRHTFSDMFMVSESEARQYTYIH